MKLIMAKYFYKSGCDESEKSLFVANNGWIDNFLCSNGFLLHSKTTTVQQDPERLIEGGYLLQV